MRTQSGPYEAFARTGYVARGIVYLTVGIIALSVVFGVRGRAQSFTEALSDWSAHPSGRILVLTIAAGLGCLALWRLAQGFLDADRLGSSFQALRRRLVYAVSSLVYLGVAIGATRIAFGGGSPSSPQSWAAWILSWPMGSSLLAVAGTGFLAVAIGGIVRAFRFPAEKRLDVERETSAWVVPIGRAGSAARAVVFGIIGYFLVASAYRNDIRQVRDMGGALNTLLAQDYGIYLYFTVAMGLLGFGVFGLFEALFRHVEPPPKCDALSALSE